MALIDRINNRIIELEKAEDEHREHNRIGYANQTKMIRWELQGLLQDECEGETSEREKANEILPLVSCRFSDADIRNIVLEMQNAAMHVHSHNLSRFETRIALQKVKRKWKL